MTNWWYLLLFSVLVKVLSANFIYQEFDGKLLNNTNWNFTIFLNRSSGIILYAIDSDRTRFSIALTTNGQNETGLNFLLVNNKFKEKTSRLCGILFDGFYCKRFYVLFSGSGGCSNCFGRFMNIYLRFNYAKVYVRCNHKPERVVNTKYGNIISNLLTVIMNPYRRYPIPRSFNSSSNKISIWMGNIGPYIGYQNVPYGSFSNQLFGCLEEFYFNNNSVVFSATNDAPFNSTCSNKYIDTNKKTYKCITVLKCLNNSFDDQYCQKVPNILTETPLTFDTEESNLTLTVVKLKWKNLSFNNFSIMNMKLRDKSLIVFESNHQNELIMRTINNKTSNDDIKALVKMPKNVYNQLVNTFYSDYMKMKISSDMEINSYIHHLDSELDSLDINFPIQLDNCTKFYGEIYLRYNIIQSQVHEENQTRNNNALIISLVISFVVAICFIAGLLFILYKKYLAVPDRNSNIYEDQMSLGVPNKASNRESQNVYDNF